MDNRRCGYKPCNKVFKPKVFWQKYHSPLCKWKDWDEKNPRKRNEAALKEANKVKL